MRNHPDARARWTVSGLVLGLVAAAASGCGDDPKKRLGETCSGDAECESGLCLEQQCLDPERDDDGDGLINRIEGRLGSSALKKDSDDDGLDDFVEVGGDPLAPKNFDGDGRNDAVESMKRDVDLDCIPDQRDADDKLAEADLAAVADLACCCEGRCSTVGVSPTAQCNAGVVTCSPDEPDRDGDGTADACDTPLIALTPGAIEHGCGEACTSIAALCPDRLPSCVAECVARASYEGMWLANYQCYASSECSDATCFAAPGFAEEPDCRDACVNASSCNVYALTGVTVTEPECRARCTGEYRADGDSVASLACLANLETGVDCRLVDAMACVTGNQICRDACDKLAVPVQPDGCRSGSPIVAQYATYTACEDRCTALGGFGEVAFLGCLTAKGCSDPGTACEADPKTAAPGCEAACTALASACPVTSGLGADPSLCQAFCTGLTLAAPWAVPADAVACIAASEGCDTAEETAGVLLRCVLGSAPEPRCATTCAAYETCAAELETPAPPACEAGCSGLVLTHPERIEPTITCVDQRASCVELPGCVPPAADDVCGPACAKRLECDPNYLGGLEKCRTDCRNDLAESLDRYADWMCQATVNSCDTACGDLSSLAPDAACVAACEGRDTCIEAGYGLCARACQGVHRAWGDATSDSCVIEQLGRRCSPVLVEACDPS